jgi:hypothetical protein
VRSRAGDVRSGYLETKEARESAASGRELIEQSVRAVSVVMIDLLAHCGEVALSDDQEVEEALAAKVPMKRRRLRSLEVPAPGCG